MIAFQIQTFVPLDGNISITLPEHLRETNVELFIAKKETAHPPKLSKEEYLALMDSFRRTLRNVDDSPISDEEYLEGINSLRGILTGTPDYSDLREETDREL